MDAPHHILSQTSFQSYRKRNVSIKFYYNWK